MESMNRRSFLAGVGATAMTMGMPVIAWADEKGDESVAPMTKFLEDDMQKYCDMGGTSLTLEELNKIRRERIDAAGDFEMPDGTVVPAVWHKLNVLTNSYGLGGPDPETGEGMAYLQELFYHDEDLAQKYIEAPMGVIFSAEDYAQQTGRDLKESKIILEDLADRCLLYREHRCGMNFYYQIPFVHGFFELSIKRMWDPEYIDVMYKDYYGAPSKPSLVPGGSPIYYSVPVDQEVVGDERIAPLSDWREVVERWDKIALCPCCCSLRQNARATGCDLPELFSAEMSDFRNVFDEHGHKLERCLAFGEEAEYYIENGLGREITKEECYQVLQDNIDAGLVIQFGYVRNANIICSCHSDCCGVLMTYRHVPDEEWESSPIKMSCSDYNLVYDRDSCIQCGACVARCPMVAISMDESGHPTVDNRCVRCGQCGLVCPAAARKLEHKPAEDCLPVPENHMADMNRKFGYRLEHGLA